MPYDAFEILARRHIPPESALALFQAVELGRALCAAQPGDIVKPSKEQAWGMGFVHVFEPLAQMVMTVNVDGQDVVHQDGQKPDGVGFLRNDVPPHVPDVPDPTSEDVLRILDLGGLSGAIIFDDLRCLAPTCDPVEAAAWIVKALTLADLRVEHLLSKSPFPRPTLPDMVIGDISGNCPVQSEGTIMGMPYYYRARGEHQSLEIGDTFVMRERVTGGRFSAGWIDTGAAEIFIQRAALSFERSRART